MELHAVKGPLPRTATVKRVKDVKTSALWTRGLAAAFGGTTNNEERERENPLISGFSLSRSSMFVVSPAEPGRQAPQSDSSMDLHGAPW